MAYAVTDFMRDREAQYAQTVDALRGARSRLSGQVIPGVISALESMRSSPWLLPVRGIVSGKADRVTSDLRSAEGLLASLVAPLQLPPWLWRNAEGWAHVREELSGMVGDLGVTNREVHVRWRGLAADAYHAVLPAQVGAAAQLASSADAVQNALSWVGTTLAIFYAGVVAIILHACAGLVVAIATAALGPEALVSLALVMLAVSALLVELGALVLATAEALARIKVWTMQVLSAMSNNASFPNGRWPRSRTDWYSDATVTDGDAEWSVMPR